MGILQSMDYICIQELHGHAIMVVHLKNCLKKSPKKINVSMYNNKIYSSMQKRCPSTVPEMSPNC